MDANHRQIFQKTIEDFLIKLYAQINDAKKQLLATSIEEYSHIPTDQNISILQHIKKIFTDEEMKYVIDLFGECYVNNLKVLIITEQL